MQLCKVSFERENTFDAKSNKQNKKNYDTETHDKCYLTDVNTR